jgi:hypothetical protein
MECYDQVSWLTHYSRVVLMCVYCVSSLGTEQRVVWAITTSDTIHIYVVCIFFMVNSASVHSRRMHDGSLSYRPVLATAPQRASSERYGTQLGKAYLASSSFVRVDIDDDACTTYYSIESSVRENLL